MKKIILLATFALLSSSAFAQKFFTSMTLNTSFTNQEQVFNSTNYGFKQFTITALPRFGYYITPKVIVGVNVGYSYIKQKSQDLAMEASINMLLTGAFVRYTHKFNKYIGAWAEASQLFAFGKSKSSSSTESDKTYNSVSAIRPGIIFFANNHLSFELSYGTLSYIYSKSKNTNSSYTRNGLGLFLTPDYSNIAVNYSF